MKTQSIERFFNGLGVETKVANESKGILELPNQGGLLIAVSQDTSAQRKATHKFRDLSHKTGRMILSCVDLNSPHGSTVVSGTGARVPVFQVFAGRFEDTYPTNGHLVTSSRLLMLMKELEAWVSTPSKKTPYLSWLVSALGVNRVKSLEALQELVIEASQHPVAAAIPALAELAAGRGTLNAVLCVGTDVAYRDTEPVVSENDWRFFDLERLTLNGLSTTQAAVIRKTSKAFEEALTPQKAQVKEATAQEDPAKEQMLELLSA